MLLLEHTCDVSRNTAVGSNGRRQLQQIATGVSCLSLPMNAATAVRNGFDIGKAYDFFFASGTDIKIKDKLTCNGSDFTVSSVESYSVPVAGHVHVLAQQEIGT